MKVNAIVLAGGSAKALEVENIASKALVELNGAPLVDFVLTSLGDTHSVEMVAVIAPFPKPQAEWVERVDLYLQADDVLTKNIEIGIRALNSDLPVLVCSSDIPLISKEAIEDFIVRCENCGGDFCYPIIPREAVISAYPTTQRTYATLKEGTYTGGNIGLIYPQVFLQNRALFEEAYGARKSPLKLFRMLGFMFIIKLLMKRLSIAEAEKQCSKLLSAKACAVATPFPQIGMDVDKPADLILVRELVDGKAYG